jgi:hypothetical protein
MNSDDLPKKIVLVSPGDPFQAGERAKAEYKGNAPYG